jgi:hypothetical protein
MIRPPIVPLVFLALLVLLSPPLAVQDCHE